MLVLLFLGAMLLLGIGVWEHTGVTGKDEYYLGLRTPMCMMEQDAWLVPCVNGEPRLKKPPLIYWLTRTSYEVFGVSLTSARLVAVTLAALLVLATALIALELGASRAQALLAGVVGLSFLSLGVGGRMLELDVPVASFSGLAFYFLLRWYRRNQTWALLTSAVLLAAGFLTKGPVVAVVCGAGALALLINHPDARVRVRDSWPALVGALLLFLALALPWFVYVGTQFPERSAQELATEISSRHFFQMSAVPLYGSLLLLLPWSFVLVGRFGQLRGLTGQERRIATMLALWLGLTLLPFFFIKTFERYLYGSLVPAALLLALVPIGWGSGLRWAARIGGAIGLIAALTLGLAVLWINGFSWVLLPMMAALGWFAQQWWRARRTVLMAASGALLWAATLGLAYPLLGINRVPEHIVAQARDRATVLYHGPQPGLLPALLGRSLIHVDDRWRLPRRVAESCAPFLVFAAEEDGARARRALAERGFRVAERERFGVLSARVSWAKMARRGLSGSQIADALLRRDLDAIKPQVLLLEATRASCPGA
jgi:4-amino-4-deoxy-L-arabinose transferase-like glycosyltransferase